ncbi:hypothetical protein FQR65_LT12930 [Abscondita terminalis]|nr:hypothetical protein FQR65_LT12930 [Abscondita terminalis]
MGKILSALYRPVRDFNLESRVHKIISKDKPLAAPKHKSKEYPRQNKESPTIEDFVQKNETLDKYLKNVYVISHHQRSFHNQDAQKPLPIDRHTIEDSIFGYHEPKRVPYGRVTLKSVLKFISEYQTDTRENTIKKIADANKLSEKSVENIISYFRVYEVYVPEKNVKTQFLGPRVARKQIVSVEQKKFTADSNKSEN